uniref:SET domain-containing protein n=2 Tax=Rhabditophanes sp. KR3021 TaxID=114890 RepID=A0AC35TKZ2_9BILA
MVAQRRQLRSTCKIDQPFAAKVTKKRLEGRQQCLISSIAIEVGQDVIEYEGKLLSGDIAKNKLEECRNVPKKLMYTYFFTYKDKSYCIDSTMCRGPSKQLICRRTQNYNLVPRIFFDEKDIEKTSPKVMFVASKPIYPGDQLVIFYGLLKMLNKS